MTEPSSNPAQNSFIGWIPTVNGRLSFRHIGEAQHPTPSSFANVTTDSTRYVVAYQRRPLSDSVFQSITDFLCGRDGNFWFATSAQTTTSHQDIDGSLVGTVYIFKSKEDWRRGPEERVRNSRTRMNEAHLSLSSSRDREIIAAWEEAGSALSQKPDIILNFVLRRDGELRVDQPRFQDSDLELASFEFADQQGSHNFNKWVADQAYFFLRDIAHHHQHHDPNIDTILILQTSGSSIEWRQNIVFSLHFYIISARRAKTLSAVMQAAGVLAYCESFLGMCKSKLSAEDFAKINLYEASALRNSLTVSVDEIKFNLERKAERTARIANFRTMTLAVIAPVLALVGVAIQPFVDKPAEYPSLYSLARFLSGNVVEIFTIGTLVLIASWAFNSMLNSFQANRVSRDILRVGAANQITAIVFGLSSALAFIAAGVYFGHPTVVALWEVFTEASAGWLGWFRS